MALLCAAMTGSLPAQTPVKRKIGNMTTRIGSPQVPVVLVQFADVAMSGDDPKGEYVARLALEATPEEVERGDGTAAQYFADQSNGKFTPRFVVIGPVTLEHPLAYYGADGAAVRDEKLGEMVAEAIEKAVASGEVDNWKDFDNDGDGISDALYLIYAGEGQHAHPERGELIWPHTSSLTERGVEPVEAAGVVFDAYSCTNELLGDKPDGIGTFCHEFCHQLGLPDFYRTDGVVTEEYAMGAWSLMDYGSYAMDGRRPVGLRALEKIYLGWIEPIVLDGATTVADWPSTGMGGSPFRIENSVSPTEEYYLAETIDNTRGWDMSCPAGGLLVTHVYLSGMDSWMNNTVNNSSPYNVTIIAADNEKTALVSGVNDEEYAEGLKGDTYPSPEGNNELTDVSTPAATTRVGLSRKMKKPLTDIAYNAERGTVSFKFMGGSEENVLTSVRTPMAEAGNGTVEYFRLDGLRIANPEKHKLLHPGIYLKRDSEGKVVKVLKNE